MENDQYIIRNFEFLPIYNTNSNLNNNNDNDEYWTRLETEMYARSARSARNARNMGSERLPRNF